MDIKKDSPREAIETKLLRIEEQLLWHETHPYKWQGNIIKSDQYRKLHANQERLRALLKDIDEK